MLAKGRRALLCYGITHLLHPVPHLPSNLVSIVEQRTGERTYTIADLVPWPGTPVAWPRSFPLIPGMPSSRPRAPGSAPSMPDWLYRHYLAARHGKLMNPYCGVPLRSVIDDGLYEGQAADLTASCWNPAIFLDPVYWRELHRRNALQGNPVNLDSYRQEQPAPVPLTKVPPSAECGQGTPG